MDWKPDWQVRREGERAFERRGYSNSSANPYERYGNYDEERAHRMWEDGQRAAERREEDRREEERLEEHRRQERVESDRWIQQQQQEDEYWSEVQARAQAEQDEP